MAIGTLHTIRVYEDDSGAVILGGFRRTPFTHDNTFTVASTSVVKEDFTGTPNDSFVIKVSYPSGSEPAMSTTLTTLLNTAKNAVNAVFGNGEAGPAS